MKIQRKLGVAGQEYESILNNGEEMTKTVIE